MQGRVTNNNGVIAEKIEGGEFHISATGVEEHHDDNRAVTVEQTVEAPRAFGLLMRYGHSPQEIAEEVERLRILCEGKNSRALMRKLIEMDKAGYIQLDDVKPRELYQELKASFGLSNITERALSESYRLMG